MVNGNWRISSSTLFVVTKNWARKQTQLCIGYVCRNSIIFIFAKDLQSYWRSKWGMEETKLQRHLKWDRVRIKQTIMKFRRISDNRDLWIFLHDPCMGWTGQQLIPSKYKTEAPLRSNSYRERYFPVNGRLCIVMIYQKHYGSPTTFTGGFEKGMQKKTGAKSFELSFGE